VAGAVNPQAGKWVGLVVPHFHTEEFQIFLDTTMSLEVNES
jgi:hypothetical protein